MMEIQKCFLDKQNSEQNPSHTFFCTQFIVFRFFKIFLKIYFHLIF